MNRAKPKEEFKTWGDVFDQFTQKTVYKLIKQGQLEGLESPISIGKEANVFSALKKDGTRVMAKIYRLETCDFNKMYEYMRDDPRFPDINRGKRKTIFAWVQREYRNLHIAREANVSVPTPHAFYNNVLILEFVGEGDEIAPKLKDKIPKKPNDFMEKVIENMKKLQKVGLVHADLSAFNILNLNEKPVLIDFSQSTGKDSYRYKEFWERDIRNVTIFFRKIGVEITEEEMKKRIFGK